MNKYILTIGLFCLIFTFSCSQNKNQNKLYANSTSKSKVKVSKNMEKATLGAGCFWCVEAVYQRLEGVESVVSGYSGGKTKNPTYEQICTGTTGHAEVVQISYDPAKTNFSEILEIFWRTHDPSTLNRQGNDVGTQYRSVIFYHNDKQKEIAVKSKEAATEAKLWPNKIVTEISPLKEFYPAEDYHQNYYNNNKKQSYCVYVVGPKVEKFKKLFKDKLKKAE